MKIGQAIASALQAAIVRPVQMMRAAAHSKGGHDLGGWLAHGRTATTTLRAAP